MASNSEPVVLMREAWDRTKRAVEKLERLQQAGSIPRRVKTPEPDSPFITAVIVGGGPNGLLTYAQSTLANPSAVPFAETHLLRVVESAGSITAFSAGIVTAPTGTATIQVDLKKNAVSVLTAPVLIDLNTADGGTVQGVIQSGTIADFVANDSLTIEVQVNPGGAGDSLGISLSTTTTTTEDPDYTDPRYWVQSARLSNADVDKNTELAYTAITDTTDPEYFFGTATNLAEVITGTHELFTGQIVHVHGTQSRNSVGVRRKWFTLLPAIVTVYAAGQFVAAGSVPTSGVAIHNGHTWTGFLDPSLTSAPVVNMLDAVLYDFGDGLNPVGCGVIRPEGSTTDFVVARWDGTRWIGVPNTDVLLGGAVTMAVYRGKLYVAGQVGVGGTYDIRVFDGISWSNVGSGGPINGNVFRLVVWQDKLYALGNFLNIDSATTANSIAVWDDSTWSVLGSGVTASSAPGNARDAVSYDPGDGSGDVLAVVGFFDTAGGVTGVFGTASWDGSTWRALGDGIPQQFGGGLSEIWAVGSFDDGYGAALYASPSPQFSGAGDRIERYRDGVWAPFFELPGVNGFARWRNRLLCSGLFRTYPKPNYMGGSLNVIRLDSAGTDWNAIVNGLNGGVLAVHIFNSLLYVGGVFTADGDGVPVDESGGPLLRIASYDDSATTPAWTAVGGGLDGIVRAITDDGTDLVVGGDFTGRYHRLTSGSWVTPNVVGGGSGVRTILHTGTTTYLGGDFVAVDGITVNGVVQIDGNDVATAMDSPAGVSASVVTAKVNSIVEHDAGSGLEIYIAGRFDAAGGTAVSNVARWDVATTSWQPLASGLPGEVKQLLSHGGSLWAAGAFHDGTTDYLASWNGTAWSGAGSLNTSRTVDSLGTHNGLLAYDGRTVDGSGGLFGGDDGAVRTLSGGSSAIVGTPIGGDILAMTTGNAGGGSTLWVGGTIGGTNPTQPDQVALRSVAEIDSMGVKRFAGGVGSFPLGQFPTTGGVATFIRRVLYEGTDQVLVSLNSVEIANNRYAELVAAATIKGWRSLGTGLRGPALNIGVFPDVKDTVYHGGKLWCFGNFSRSVLSDGTTTPTGGVARWDGVTWDEPVSPGPSVRHIAATVNVVNRQQQNEPEKLWVHAASESGISRFNEDTGLWEDITPTNLNVFPTFISDMKEWGGRLWLVGDLLDFNAITHFVMTGLSGEITWSFLDVPGIVSGRTLFASPNGVLYMGSFSTSAAIHRWRNGLWEPFPNSPSGTCTGLAWLPESVDGPDMLIASGPTLVLSDGVNYGVVAYDFDAAQWIGIAEQFGSGQGIAGGASLVSSRRLRDAVLGGTFTNIGTQFGFSNIARWDRQSWNPMLKTGVSFLVNRLGEPAEAAEQIADTAAPGTPDPFQLSLHNQATEAWALPFMLATNPGGCIYYG